MAFPFIQDPPHGTQVMLEGKVWEYKVTRPPGDLPLFPNQPSGHWDVSNVITATDYTFSAGDVLSLGDTTPIAGEPGGSDPTEEVTPIVYNFDMDTIEEQQ